jgi:hypothetical protein
MVITPNDEDGYGINQASAKVRGNVIIFHLTDLEWEFFRSWSLSIL